jgi:hypothetical protein
VLQADYRPCTLPRRLSSIYCRPATLFPVLRLSTAELVGADIDLDKSRSTAWLIARDESSTWKELVVSRPPGDAVAAPTNINNKAAFLILCSGLCASLLSLDNKACLLVYLPRICTTSYCTLPRCATFHLMHIRQLFINWTHGDGMFTCLCTCTTAFVLSSSLYMLTYKQQRAKSDAARTPMQLFWLFARGVMGGVSILGAFASFSRLDMAVFDSQVLPSPRSNS